MGHPTSAQPTRTLRRAARGRAPGGHMRLLPGAVAGLALLLTAACSTGTPTAATSPASSSPAAAPTSATSSPPAALTATAPAPASAPAVQRLTLTVSGNSVTGDTGTVPIKLGQPVELTVTSDVADEVHVHGADVGKDVEAGGTVVIDFVQKAPGRFEVELESRKRTLTRLQVS